MIRPEDLEPGTPFVDLTDETNMCWMEILRKNPNDPRFNSGLRMDILLSPGIPDMTKYLKKKKKS